MLYSDLLSVLIALTTVGAGAPRLIPDKNSALTNFTCEMEPELVPLPKRYMRKYRFWLLPTGELLNPRSKGTEQAKVLSFGQTLSVLNLADAKSQGKYYCLVYTPRLCQFKVASKHEINLGRLFYLKHEYRFVSKVLGAAAFCVLTVLCVVVVAMLIWNNRRAAARAARAWQNPGLQTSGTATRCCSNLAFLSERACCTKPPAYTAATATTTTAATPTVAATPTGSAPPPPPPTPTPAVSVVGAGEGNAVF